jgi:hypothetical protein
MPGPDAGERWPSPLVATASENRLTDHHASNAMELLTSAQSASTSSSKAKAHAQGGRSPAVGAAWSAACFGAQSQREKVPEDGASGKGVCNRKGAG